MGDKPWVKRSDESDRAYAAFQLYLGIPPETRTVFEAFRLYAKGFGDSKGQIGRSPSGSFQRWVDKYNWVARGRAWDDHQRSRLQETLLERGRDDYVLKVENSRSLVENIATGTLQKCQRVDALIGKSIEELEAKPMEVDRKYLALILDISRALKSNIEASETARVAMYDALGLIETVTQLRDVNDGG
jgi:hypothetical protein